MMIKMIGIFIHIIIFNNMKHLLFILFGFTPKNKNHSYTFTVKSIHPDNRPSEQEWINEFNVSLLYNKKIVHF